MLSAFDQQSPKPYHFLFLYSFTPPNSSTLSQPASIIGIASSAVFDNLTSESGCVIPVYELGVDHCAGDGFVAEKVFHVQQVLCLMIGHGRPEMSESV